MNRSKIAGLKMPGDKTRPNILLIINLFGVHDFQHNQSVQQTVWPISFQMVSGLWLTWCLITGCCTQGLKHIRRHEYGEFDGFIYLKPFTAQGVRGEISPSNTSRSAWSALYFKGHLLWTWPACGHCFDVCKVEIGGMLPLSYLRCAWGEV